MCKTEVWIPEMGKVVNLSLDRNNIQMSVIAGLVKVSFKTVRSSSKIRICDESLWEEISHKFDNTEFVLALNPGYRHQF